MIDINKQYRTRDGRDVRIYATDGGFEKNMIHGAIKYTDGWHSKVWFVGGRYYGGQDSPFDLIEVRPRHKRTVWVNVYNRHTFLYDTREEADGYVDRIACIKVELDFEEGEGL